MEVKYTLENMIFWGCKMKKKDSIIFTQANDLIDGSYSLTLPEIRWLYLILTKIDSKKPQPEGFYTVYAKEYIDIYGLKEIGYKQVKNVVESLASKPVVLFSYNEEKKRIEKDIIYWFTRINQGVGDAYGDVTVKFSEDVRDYLYELKESFTQINLEEMVKLDSPVAFRIYSWLMKYKLMNKNKKENGVICTNPLDIEWIKIALGMDGLYPKYGEFKRRVIEPAVTIINNTTGITVTYKEIKSNRKVESIIFCYIDEKLIDKIKPARPRMPNRPRVTKGSAAEGDWARTCIELMRGYLKKLRAYDPKLNLSKPDLEKVFAWHKVIGNNVDNSFWDKNNEHK